MLDNPKAITELTDILDRDIETIVAMRIRAERKVSRHQRLIKSVERAGSAGRGVFHHSTRRAVDHGQHVAQPVGAVSF